MAIEQFKNILPEREAVYVNKHKVKTVSEGVSLADGYALIHKTHVRDVVLRNNSYSRRDNTPHRFSPGHSMSQPGNFKS